MIASLARYFNVHPIGDTSLLAIFLTIINTQLASLESFFIDGS